jgi:DNA-binding transcriptional ArsR family regulator
MDARAIDWEHVGRATLHGTKIKILEHLVAAGTDVSPREISEAIGVSLGATSYHVRQLAEMGLIDLSRTEPRRGALAHFYVPARGVVS